ncbi:MAG: AmmeMemoRadiSam system protein B, partial [Deltaproteobacteria bacterium]|nr:AmmeMemoRadiSam system protein B [Deltaproteobacteria bacterium]
PVPILPDPHRWEVDLTADRRAGHFLLVFFCVSWPILSHAKQAGTPSLRPPAVAGLFYPADPTQLRSTVRQLLHDASGAHIEGVIHALVSPHAGYRYSGVVAAAGYKQIDPSTKTVILLGPSHHVPLSKASVPDVAAYETPLGHVPVAGLVQKLKALPFVDSVAAAHQKEHSLEVQLPFLQVVLNNFDIVPILTNNADPQALASALAPYVDMHTLVVASSDLSHYYSYKTAKDLDKICTHAITTGAFSDMALCQACGKQAVLTLMRLAQIKGWQARLIDYKNSGDTAGDKSRVVGYASIAFVAGKEMSSTMKDQVSRNDRKALLTLARSAIEHRLVDGARVKRPESGSAVLRENRGCFVTLHKSGQLRGCIGTIEPLSPLVECVEENARNAAFRDPRFPPLTEVELPDIDIEISVLTVPKRIAFKDGEDLKRQLRPGIHGVILSRGFKRSTFLPQVWEQLPDKEKFLEHLCLKGGMSSSAWKDPKTQVEVYEAEVFGEKDFE